MRGEAEAYAIEVKAKAEAEQVRVASSVLGYHHGGGHDGDYSGVRVWCLFCNGFLGICQVSQKSYPLKHLSSPDGQKGRRVEGVRGGGSC